MKRAELMMMVGMIAAFLAGCHLSMPHEIQSGIANATGDPGPVLILAGEWEYEDSGIVQTLRLDRQGNGRYPWKGGRFLTASLIGQSWTGSWQQRENDREGGFEIVLTPDYSEGEGRWWYTRIEDDHAPTRPGGAFTVRRASVVQEGALISEASDAR